MISRIEQPRLRAGIQQSQNLRLDGHVKRCGRLVCDDQLRLAGNSDGDHHPLSQTPESSCGNARMRRSRIGNLDSFEKIDRRRRGVDQLQQLAPDSHRRVKRGHRVLEDGPETVAAKLASSASEALGMSTPSTESSPSTRGLDCAEQAQHGQPEDGLTRAGLANQAKDLARSDLEIDPPQDRRVS